MTHGIPFAWTASAFIAYTILIFVIARLSARGHSSSSFFRGDRKAPWPVVAYGMIGASISGVTFISVPGNVWNQNFYYMPMVLGFAVGYVVIAKVLLPLYYRLGLSSIYTYLGERFGRRSYWTGTSFFILSRLLGAAARIYVAIVVLLTFLPSDFIQALSPSGAFCIIAAVFLSIVYLYTYRGGVRSIIWTDVLQTTFMLLAVVLGIIFICRDMGWTAGELLTSVGQATNTNSASAGFGHGFTNWFDWDWGHGTNAVKQFVSGIVVTVAMTGLDQAMMQKNLACKDLASSQKNMYSTGATIIVVNLSFLLLGALLCVYMADKGGFEAFGISRTDEIFPAVAGSCLGTGVAVFFLIGLISASYPSAGAAMTSLTSAICVDYLGFSDRNDLDDKGKERLRKRVQAAVAMAFFIIMAVLFLVSNDAVINLIYKLASYTYGPLLGIFFFGILTRVKVRDKATPFVAAASPVLCLILNTVLKRMAGFDLGFSLLLVNGLLSFAGMYICSLGQKNGDFAE